MQFLRYAEWWEKPDKVTNDILEAIRLAENDEPKTVVVPQPSSNHEKEVLINAVLENKPIENDEVLQTSIINKVEVDRETSNFYTLTNLASINAYSSDEFFGAKIGRRLKSKFQTF